MSEAGIQQRTLRLARVRLVGEAFKELGMMRGALAHGQRPGLFDPRIRAAERGNYGLANFGEFSPRHLQGH
jgi:hypothetical protein